MKAESIRFVIPLAPLFDLTLEEHSQGNHPLKFLQKRCTRLEANGSVEE